MLVSETRTRAVTAGRYEFLASALRLDRIRERGIPLFVRATGGIPVELAPGVLHLAWVLPHPSVWVDATPRNIINRYIRGLLRALSGWGLDPLYAGKEWVLCRGSHIAYVTYEVTADMGVLLEAFFAREASWCLEPGLLAYPVEDSFRSGGHPSDTLSNLARRNVGLDEFAARVRDSHSEMYRIEWQTVSVPNPTDLDTSSGPLLSEPPDLSGMGCGKVRDSIGFVEVWTRLQQGRLSDVRLYGDFLSDSSGHALLCERLHGTPADRAALTRVVESVYREGRHFLIGVKPDSVVEAILASVKDGPTSTSGSGGSSISPPICP